jgi:hypothetical protein
MHRNAEKDALELLSYFDPNEKGKKLTKRRKEKLIGFLQEETPMLLKIDTKDLDLMENEYSKDMDHARKFVGKTTVKGSEVFNSILRFSIEFVDEFKEYVDWNNPTLYSSSFRGSGSFGSPNYSQGFSRSKIILNRFISKFSNYINWDLFLFNVKISESEAVLFYDNIDWKIAIKYLELSEGFMRMYADTLDWTELSRYQKMGDEFIYEMRDHIDWNSLVKYQKLSPTILHAFYDKFNVDDIMYFQRVDKFFRMAHHADFDRCSISSPLIKANMVSSCHKFIKSKVAE